MCVPCRSASSTATALLPSPPRLPPNFHIPFTSVLGRTLEGGGGRMRQGVTQPPPRAAILSNLLPRSKISGRLIQRMTQHKLRGAAQTRSSVTRNNTAHDWHQKHGWDHGGISVYIQIKHKTTCVTDGSKTHTSVSLYLAGAQRCGF